MRIKERKQIEMVLEKAGFSDKEVAIYLALLKLGHGTVSEITRGANISRTYGYPILDSLSARGLASISGKEPKQEYFAESPNKLFKYLENEFELQKKLLGQVKELLPELIVLHNVEDRPKIRFYEGTEGIKEVYENTLTSKGEVMGFATYEELHKAMPHYFPDYYLRRAKKGIFGRGIITDTPEGRVRNKFNDKEAREIRFVPKEYYFYPEIDIYDNKVMIASWREKLGIIIESDEIADALKKIFKLAWIGAEKLDEKEKSPV
ncbi:MAG: helix-turn-helix domain-containing protein [Candidatus Paceibacterota bacterium]|jgi:sugar-specific transcriptional regulator TrmB